MAPKNETPLEKPFTIGRPSQDVLDYMKGRRLQPSFHWTEVWQETHAEAFTVAKAQEMDILRLFQESLTDAHKNGKTLAQWSKEVTPQLKKRDWWGKQSRIDPKTGKKVMVQLGSQRRLKTIYNTNMRTSRAVGQWMRIQRTKDILPYLLYGLGPSIRHRPEHVNKEGICLPIDDPFWNAWFPPNGWMCKCHVRQVGAEEAKGYNQSAPKIEYKNWENKRTGEIIKIPKGIDAGFAHNPGKSRMAWLNHHPEGQKLKAIYEEKRKENVLIPPVFSTNKNIDAKALQDAFYKIPHANKRVDKTLNFIHKNNIQTVIINNTEMNPRTKTSKALLDDILDYLPQNQRKYGWQNYANRQHKTLGGFTANEFNHVIVKADKSISFGGEASKILSKQTQKAIRAYHKGKKERFFTICGGVEDKGTETFGIYIHELGHQIHFKAGFPPVPEGAKFLTRYIDTQPKYEWFSESFSAWLLNYDEYVKFDPIGAKFFDDLMKDY